MGFEGGGFAGLQRGVAGDGGGVLGGVGGELGFGGGDVDVVEEVEGQGLDFFEVVVVVEEGVEFVLSAVEAFECKNCQPSFLRSPKGSMGSG